MHAIAGAVSSSKACACVLNDAHFATCDVQLYKRCTCVPSPFQAWRRFSVRSSRSLGSTLMPMSCQPLCGPYSSTFMGCQGSCSSCLQQWRSQTTPMNSRRASCSRACACPWSTQRGSAGSPMCTAPPLLPCLLPNCLVSAPSPLHVGACCLIDTVVEAAWRVRNARRAVQAAGGVASLQRFMNGHILRKANDVASHNSYRPLVSLLRLLDDLSKEGLTTSVPRLPGRARVGTSCVVCSPEG